MQNDGHGYLFCFLFQCTVVQSDNFVTLSPRVSGYGISNISESAFH